MYYGARPDYLKGALYKACTRNIFSGRYHKVLSLTLEKQGNIQCLPLHSMMDCCVGDGYSELCSSVRASVADTTVHRAHRWDSTQVLHQCSYWQSMRALQFRSIIILIQFPSLSCSNH
jgi:hypothetical protein